MASLPSYSQMPPMGAQNQMQTSRLIMSQPSESTKGMNAILQLYKPKTNTPNQKQQMNQVQAPQQPEQQVQSWGLPQYMS